MEIRTTQRYIDMGFKVVIPNNIKNTSIGLKIIAQNQSALLAVLP